MFKALTGGVVLCACLLVAAFVVGHDKSLEHFIAQRRLQTALAARSAESAAPAATCRLTVQLQDASNTRPVRGLVRIKNLDSDKFLEPKQLIKRDNHWFVLPSDGQVDVAPARLRVEAVAGLELLPRRSNVNATGKTQAIVRMPLKRFYDAGARGWRSGNTHLHIMRLTMPDTIRYLQEVPQADDLDLVFVSYLLRTGDNRRYTSNEITRADLQRFSRTGVRFGNGEEHRHNFEAYGEGFGHVMLLDLLRLIEPVSIGPGITKKGSDGIPLQRGIKRAREDGATVIWCHNTYGFEDLPNWAAGLLHAQNIFDGGQRGSYQETFYRYLDLGFQVPFSTGTDWFIYDYSRVYVPDSENFTAKTWLSRLRAGRTFITNGTFLELQVNGKSMGDTLTFPGPSRLSVNAKAIGRHDFKALELVHNGKVVQRVKATEKDGHYEAVIDRRYRVTGSGWLAVRITVNNNKNEFGHNLFAHTSPVYLQVAGRRRFRVDVAEGAIAEMQKAIEVIKLKGKFATAQEKAAVLGVYQRGIARIRELIALQGAQQR